MKQRLRRTIPKEKLFVVKSNTKKIDFNKKFKFIYFDWWFQIVSVIFFCCCWPLAGLCALYFGLRVTDFPGRKFLRRQGCITVSNHCHYFDTVFASWVFLPQRLYISVAQQNFEVPIIRRILRLLRCFPIPKIPNKFDLIVGPIGEALSRGYHVHFLPEGDLVYLSQEIYRFKSGAFRMAYLHQAPVLPMVYVLKRRSIFGKEQSPHWPRIWLIYGEPLFPPPLSEDGILPIEKIHGMMDKVADWMEDTIALYQRKTLQTTSGGPVG